jgi:hypothetical protein
MRDPEKRTLRFARLVVRRRAPIAALLVLATLFFLYPTANAVLSALGRPLPGPVVRVDSRARDLFPDHPFIQAQDKFAGRFGNSTLVAIALAVEEGTIFNPETLEKIGRITRSLDGWDYDAKVPERRAVKKMLHEIGYAADEIKSAKNQKGMDDVWVIKRGESKEIALIVTYYDKIGQGSQGVIDNGVGVVVTLGAAKAMRLIETNLSYIFLFWGGEEIGQDWGQWLLGAMALEQLRF